MAAGVTRQQGIWLGDFAWGNGALIVRKTGIRLEITGALLNEIINWALYLAILNVVALTTRLSGRRRPSIWFAPDRPRQWYLVRGALMWGGMDLAARPDRADAALYFDDSTTGTAPSYPGRHLNGRCNTIAKSYVASVFADVFGYPLSVDPATTHGEMVEKPEINGVHGGRIVTGPRTPRPGHTYQRIIDTLDAEGCCRDLRTPCAGGVPVVVWTKIKSPDGRFSINNKSARLDDPRDVFSDDERQKIGTFCARMGLDWGGLDILRDRDGRIYIVDVNKTDLGPVIALSWRDKIVSMHRLARALRALIADVAR